METLGLVMGEAVVIECERNTDEEAAIVSVYEEDKMKLSSTLAVQYKYDIDTTILELSSFRSESFGLY